MTSRTRYFVIASLLVLGIGLGTVLVAYYTGFQMSAVSSRGGPQELQLVPSNVAVVAYADVREVMNSELRHKVHEAAPVPEDGQREFENKTGINIETDVDRIVACLDPGPRDHNGSGMVLARGRFNEPKIESLMRAHGARVDDYRGKRIIVSDLHGQDDNLSVAFVEPGLVAVGSSALVRSAIDLQHGGDSVTNNDEMMSLVRSLDSGNAWAVGRFDALRSKANLPEAMSSQIPPITWFSVTSHVNGGIRGVIRAETRDEQSANNLRDVVRGFMALAKLQAGAKPEMQAMLQSLELGGSGKTVALNFSVPVEVLDVLGKHGSDRTNKLKPR
jgi:hypothetical protein